MVEDEEVEEEQQPKQTKLAPILPVVELYEEDVVDMTAGDDVVRRVLEEVESDEGAVAYMVELGDYSVEKVRLHRIYCASSIIIPYLCALPLDEWNVVQTVQGLLGVERVVLPWLPSECRAHCPAPFGWRQIHLGASHDQFISRAIPNAVISTTYKVLPATLHLQSHPFASK